MRYAEPNAERRDVSLRCLVHRAQNGSQQAWGELVSRHAGLVWSVTRAHRLSESDAADVSQATWMRLVEHLGRIRDPEALPAWLATTARRESLRTLRSAARSVPCAETPETVDDGPEIDDSLLNDERDGELWRAFSRLRESDQALLRMLASDPAPSYAEIAAALAMPIGSIGPTRARALERLRAEMEDELAA